MPPVPPYVLCSANRSFINGWWAYDCLGDGADFKWNVCHLSFGGDSLPVTDILLSPSDSSFSSWSPVCTTGGGTLLSLTVIVEDNRFGVCRKFVQPIGVSYQLANGVIIEWVYAQDSQGWYFVRSDNDETKKCLHPPLFTNWVSPVWYPAGSPPSFSVVGSGFTVNPQVCCDFLNHTETYSFVAGGSAPCGYAVGGSWSFSRGGQCTMTHTLSVINAGPARIGLSGGACATPFWFKWSTDAPSIPGGNINAGSLSCASPSTGTISGGGFGIPVVATFKQIFCAFTGCGCGNATVVASN